MILFDPETSLIFAELIAKWSPTSPNYIASSNWGCYVFSRAALLRRAWVIAVAILCGSEDATDFPERIVVKRPGFMCIIIDMLCSLVERVTQQSYEDHEGALVGESGKLLREVMSLFINRMPYPQVHHFLQKNCIILLYNLSNCGVCPNSFSPNELDRLEKAWTVFEMEEGGQPSKGDLTPCIQLLDENPIVPSDGVVTQEDINECKVDFNFLHFPFDNATCDWQMRVMTDYHIASLFPTIVLSSDPAQMGVLLFDLVSGHAFMYPAFAKAFGEEILIGVLAKITEGSYPDYHRPIFNAVHRCVVSSLVTTRFIELLALLLSFLKMLSHIDDLDLFFANDPHSLPNYRDLILASFVFAPEASSVECV